MGTHRPRLWLIATGLLVAAAAPVRAQTSDSGTIDAVRGTIQGSTRYIGLGGAFVAIADDTEGLPLNPASAAVRLPYSWSAFSFSLGVDVSISTWLPKNNLYNAPDQKGASSSSGSLFGSLGLLFNYRHAGFGLNAQAAQNQVSQKAQGVSSDLTANFGLMHAIAAYGFLDGQLQLGAGLRILGFSFDRSESSTPLTAGFGAVAGVILKPKARQFRIGASFQQAITAQVSNGSGGHANVEVPWTAGLGFAYQFGTRKLNPSFVTVDERARRNTAGREPTKDELKKAERELFEEYQKAQTWYLLLSTELALIEGGGHTTLGGSAAIGHPLISPRLGLETELVPHWLRLRAGSYLELATTEGGAARLHGTGGVDIKLFEWNVFGLIGPFDYWQLSLAADGADSYLNTSFSIGFWH